MRSICYFNIFSTISLSSVLYFRMVFASLNQLLWYSWENFFSRFCVPYTNKLVLFVFHEAWKGQTQPSLNREEGSGAATELCNNSSFHVLALISPCKSPFKLTSHSLSSSGVRGNDADDIISQIRPQLSSAFLAGMMALFTLFLYKK